jgi:hypothetical protein
LRPISLAVVFLIDSLSTSNAAIFSIFSISNGNVETVSASMESERENFFRLLTEKDIEIAKLREQKTKKAFFRR